MTITKGFVVLALLSCALAMPLSSPVDETPDPTDRKSTSGSNVDASDSESPRKPEISSVGNNRNADDHHEAASHKTTTNPQQQHVESVAHQISERSAVNEASESDDLETAAGTNVLRPLFVYRQQVAYRQRIKDARRRGFNSPSF